MDKDYRQLWEAAADSTDKIKAVRCLAKILAKDKERHFISDVGKEGAELCIDILNYALENLALSSREMNRFLNAVRRLSDHYVISPCHVVVLHDLRVSDEVLASGGFGDVRAGWYKERRVAVKTAKVKPTDNLEKKTKQFYKEIVLWSRLSHPNVLKLVGVRENRNEREFITISDLMERGTIMDYIEKYPVNRLELLHGAALGLEYLHSVRLAHGDLKGANILVSNDIPPRASLADFGFITGIEDPGDETSSCSAQAIGGTFHFMSPELLVPPHGKAIPTPEADIYAFGLVIFQVLTATVPFGHHPGTAIGFHVVSRGERPPKPDNGPDIGFCETLWCFAERCWNAEVGLRPKVGEVVALLGEVAANWVGLMPPCPKKKSVASGQQEEKTDPDGPNPYFDTSSITTDSYADSALFSDMSTQSTQFSDVPEDEYREKAHDDETITPERA